MSGGTVEEVSTAMLVKEFDRVRFIEISFGLTALSCVLVALAEATMTDNARTKSEV